MDLCQNDGDILPRNRCRDVLSGAAEGHPLQVPPVALRKFRHLQLKPIDGRQDLCDHASGYIPMRWLEIECKLLESRSEHEIWATELFGSHPSLPASIPVVGFFCKAPGQKQDEPSLPRPV